MSDLRRLAGKIDVRHATVLVAATVCWVLILASAGPSQAQCWLKRRASRRTSTPMSISNFLMNE